MNAKILKYELFSLFLVTVITLVVFYYRDTLPDNYLSISSTSVHGFFSYYGTSLFNFYHNKLVHHHTNNQYNQSIRSIINGSMIVIVEQLIILNDYIERFINLK